MTVFARALTHAHTHTLTHKHLKCYYHYWSASGVLYGHTNGERASLA